MALSGGTPLLPLSWNQVSQSRLHTAYSTYCDPQRRDGNLGGVRGNSGRLATGDGRRRSAGMSFSGPMFFQQQQSQQSQPSISFAPSPPTLSLVDFLRTMNSFASRHELTEHVAEAYIAQLAPEIHDQVDALFRRKVCLQQFLHDVAELHASRTLPQNDLLETTLPHFRRAVESIMSAGGPEENKDCQVGTLIEQCGPETKNLLKTAWYGRTTTDSFLNEIVTDMQWIRSLGSSFNQFELEYVIRSLLDAEEKFQPRPIEQIQTAVTLKMRTVLVDWMAEICDRFKFSQEALHLAVALVDRFLMVQRVPRNELQLVGVSAMLLAGKYEEVYPPELAEFVSVAGSNYTREEIVRMERQIFVQLEYCVTFPTANAIANCYLGQQDPTPTRRQKSITNFILDCSLMFVYYGQFKPSLLAATAVWIGRAWCQIPTSTPPPSRIIPLIPVVLLHVQDALAAPTGRATIRSKYSQPRNDSVSCQPLPSESILAQAYAATQQQQPKSELTSKENTHNEF